MARLGRGRTLLDLLGLPTDRRIRARLGLGRTLLKLLGLPTDRPTD